MTLTLYPPLCFNESGPRDNNKNSISPAVGTAGMENRIFGIYDGVGGGASGEIESALPRLLVHQHQYMDWAG